MIDKYIALLAPHLCSGCGKEGALLCQSCKNDILTEPFAHCAVCIRRPAGMNGMCGECTAPYERIWCVGDRRDSLHKLIDGYKFSNKKSTHLPLAELLDEYLPELPSNTVIVPVPTINAHIRQRGYDHMLLVAKSFAKLRGLKVDTKLQRATSSQQRFANREQRFEQAKRAFMHKGKADSHIIYLVLDDVLTTGATLEYAAKTLLDAGAQKVWTATISRQPVD